MSGQISELIGTMLKPKGLLVDEISPRRARITLEPLERGFGHTLGNALRRVLLSSIPGSAITEVEIQGILHEYTTIEGVQQDVLEILLNLKQLAIRLHGRDEATFTLSKVGPGAVTAGDIAVDHTAEVANPDLVIANLTAKSELSMSLTIRRGRGYEPASVREADGTEERPIGKLPLDATFSPVLRVAIDVEAARAVELGGKTDVGHRGRIAEEKAAPVGLGLCEGLERGEPRLVVLGPEGLAVDALRREVNQDGQVL